MRVCVGVRLDEGVCVEVRVEVCEGHGGGQGG